MTTTTPTTTPEKAPATGSSSSPDSTESKATASPTRASDVALVQMLRAMIGEELKSINDKMDQRFDGVDNQLAALNTRLTTVDKRTGLLVEEAARKFVTRNFGEKFSRSFTIKSIHDIITLIAQANTSTLPDGDRIAATKAVKNVVDFLYPLLALFLEVAVDKIVNTMDTEAVFNSEALKDDKQKIRVVQEELKAAAKETEANTQTAEANTEVDMLAALKVAMQAAEANTESDTQAAVLAALQAAVHAATQAGQAKLVQRCGIVLGSVNALSTVEIDGESKADKVARDEKMNKRFKLKLERIKKSLKGGKHGLATCEGAGILLCNALAPAGRAVWKGGETSTSDWIRRELTGETSIFESKQEMECDCCPSVEIVAGHSTLIAGEIKTNIDARGDATKQMREQVQLLEFGLWCIFGDTIKADKIVKKGHLFVLEAKDNHQGLKYTVEEDGISIFVYKVGH